VYRSLTCKNGLVKSCKDRNGKELDSMQASFLNSVAVHSSRPLFGTRNVITN